MKYYIIAGEASGDLHGANLIKGLRESDPNAEFRFWGGDKMKEASGGVKPIKHYRETAIMGFTAVVLNLRKIQGFFKLCKQDIAQWQPDAVIYIDYPGFNLKMAKWSKQRGIQTLYYISPKVWAWKEGRVKAMKKYLDRLYVIFPFEVEWFKQRGIEAHYVGNPLLDEIEARKASKETENQDNKPKKPIIALVAGSRKMEVQHNLPVMVEVMRQFPEYQGVVTGVDWLDEKIYTKALGKNSDVKVVYGKTYKTLEQASAALVTSGTATLETALLDVPQVVCYRGPSVSMTIARMILQGRIKWISLVNIIMQRTAVTELVGNHVFVANNGAKELRDVLPNGERHDEIMESYKELKEMLGGTGASEKCGRMVVEYLREVLKHK